MSHDSAPLRIHFHYPFGGRVGVVSDPIEEAWTNGIWLLDWAKPQWPDNKDIEVQGTHDNSSHAHETNRP